MSAPVDVSALRSLALQTKKRKVDEVDVSTRPPVSSKNVANVRSSSPLAPSFDQGTSLDAKFEPAVDGASNKLVSNQISSKNKDAEDDREDGEISEDDVQSAPPKPASPILYTPNIRPPGILPPTMISHNNNNSSSNNPLVLPSLSSFPVPPPPTLAVEPRFPPPSPALLEVFNKPAGPKKKKIKTAKGPKIPVKTQPQVATEPKKIDPVKAGADELQISEEEYAESRTLLIELLSWGVEPEYFVTQGFSRKALLVYCRDLKIRLPTNLPPTVPLTTEKDRTHQHQEEKTQLDDTTEKIDSFKNHIDLLDRISMQDQTLDVTMTDTSPSTSTPLINAKTSATTVESQVAPIPKSVGPSHDESDVHSKKLFKQKKEKKTSGVDTKGGRNPNAPISSSKVAVIPPSPASNTTQTLSSTTASGILPSKNFQSNTIAKPFDFPNPPPPPPPTGPPPPLPVKSPVFQNITLAQTPSEPQLQFPQSNMHLQHPLDPNFAYLPPPNWNHHQTIYSPSNLNRDRLNPISNVGTYGSYVDPGSVGVHPFHPQHQNQQQMVFPDLYAPHSSIHPTMCGFPSPGLSNETFNGGMAGLQQFNFLPSASNSPSAPMGIVSPADIPQPDSKESLSSPETVVEKEPSTAPVSDQDPAHTDSTNTTAAPIEVDLTAVEAHRKAVLQARKALLLEKRRMEEDKRTESTLSERLREKKEEVARREKELAEKFREMKAAKEMAAVKTAESATGKAGVPQPIVDSKHPEKAEQSERMVMSEMKKTAMAKKLPPRPSTKEIEIVVLSSDDEDIEEGEVKECTTTTAEEVRVSSPIPISTPLASSQSSASILASAPSLSSSVPSSPRLPLTRSLLGPKQLTAPLRRSASAHKRPSALDFDHKAPTTFGYPSNSIHMPAEGASMSRPKPLVPEQAWRFVIDISDCEASDEENEGTTPVPSRIRSATSRKSPVTTTATLSPPGNHINGASTAEADMEAKFKLKAKESEIRRMVELIAAMEKKQKAKPVSSVSTSSLATIPSEFQPTIPVQPIDGNTESSSSETPGEKLLARASPIHSPTVAIVDKAQEMLRTHQTSGTVDNEMAGQVDERMTGAVERLEEALEQRMDLLQKVENELDIDRDKMMEKNEKEEDKDIPATTSSSDIGTGEPTNGDSNDKILPFASTHAIEKSTELTNPEYPSVTYTSPLAFFPLLMPTRSQPTQNRSESIIPALRTFCLSKRHLDPSRALCQWELQGGSCSDITCQFTHWKDTEPTDDEIAAFLLDQFGSIVSAEKVRVVVRAARESSARSLTFADVAQKASTLLLSLS